MTFVTPLSSSNTASTHQKHPPAKTAVLVWLGCVAGGMS
jgi:hypothetical protein